MTCYFPYPPSNLVRPVDQIEMVDILQGTLVRAPFRTGHAHEPVIVSLDLLDDLMGLSKGGIEGRLEHGTV